MSDPRGRGFRRGNGKWHAPRPAIQLPHPVHYGWTYLYQHPECDRPVYGLGDYKLMPVSIRDGHYFLQCGDSQPWELTGWTLMEVTVEAKSGIPFDGVTAGRPDVMTESDEYF